MLLGVQQEMGREGVITNAQELPSSVGALTIQTTWTVIYNAGCLMKELMGYPNDEAAIQHAVHGYRTNIEGRYMVFKTLAEAGELPNVEVIGKLVTPKAFG